MDNFLTFLALLLPAFSLAAPAAAARVDVSFEVEPRVEFLSAVLRTAKKLPARTSYETEADAVLAPFAGDPAVAAIAAEADRDPRANLPAQRLLGAQPKDAAAEVLYARSRFARFAAAHHDYYRRLVARARKRAAADVSPEALARYLGTPLAGPHRFILAPLLPVEYETEFRVDGAAPAWFWIHSGRHAAAPEQDFMFTGVGNGVAHELAHTVVDPLAAAGTTPSGAPPKGCNDNGGPSWRACEAEHVVYAVTLRALARERGEAASRRQLEELSGRGFPFLPALCERLKEYEAARSRYPSLAAFYPRLEAVFKENHP